MPNLKNLVTRIKSVKSTQKITKVMQMIAAAKLTAATIKANKSAKYAKHLTYLLSNTIANHDGPLHKLITGGHNNEDHILIAISSDKGLCGGYNHNITKAIIKHIKSISSTGKKVKIVTIGNKVNAFLTRHGHEDDIIYSTTKAELLITMIREITDIVTNTSSDSCSILYTKYVSTVEQNVLHESLIPYQSHGTVDTNSEKSNENSKEDMQKMEYSYEPKTSAVLINLAQQNIFAQIYRTLANSIASEQILRMMAMDNASKNASDVIDKLTLIYNRTRQAVITKDLIEVISGAEAL